MIKLKEEFIPDFLQIPQVVMHLPPADRFVFGAIYFYSQLSHKKCFVSNATLGRIAFIGSTSVANSLNSLEEKGFIKRFYKDEAKRNRDYIKCLVKFGRVSSEEDRPIHSSGNVDNTVDEHIDNIYKEDILTEVSVTKNFDPIEEFDKWTSSSQEWLAIIGAFAKRRNLNLKLKTHKQCQELISRYRKVATQLAAFDRKQIIQGFNKCDEWRDKSNNPYSWTLDNVLKELLK